MPKLFDPLEIGKLTLDNRIVLPPMHTGKASETGEVTDSLIEHYRERAGRIGLLITGHAYISPEGKFVTDEFKNQLGIYKDELIPGLKSLAESVQNEGTPAAVEINHAGANTDGIPGSKPVAPSPTENARKLEKEEIQKIKNDFVEAAKRAIKAGFEAIEIHGAHEYLLNEFYSPLTNNRNDEYGGSFENRIRLTLQIVEKVRDSIGDKVLIYRLGSVDLNQNGIQIEESKKFAKKLVDSGVDILDVSGGICGSRPSELEGKQGFFIPQANEIKKSVEVPVIGVGGIKDPEYADKVIREELVELVAVGRAQLSDPNWARKAAEKLK